MRRASFGQSKLSVNNASSNLKLISGYKELRPQASQRLAADQSVMFGQHVDSIINEPSPKISKILPDIDNLELKEMDYTQNFPRQKLHRSSFFNIMKDTEKMDGSDKTKG